MMIAARLVPFFSLRVTSQNDLRGNSLPGRVADFTYSGRKGSPGRWAMKEVNLSEAVVKPTALGITALLGGSQSSCPRVYTPVSRRLAPCAPGARDGFSTASNTLKTYRHRWREEFRVVRVTLIGYFREAQHDTVGFPVHQVASHAYFFSGGCRPPNKEINRSPHLMLICL